MVTHSGRTEKPLFRGAPTLLIFLMAGLTVLVYYIWICVHYYDGALICPRTAQELKDLLRLIPAPTCTSVLIFIIWVLYHAIMQFIAPGKTHMGMSLPDGSRLPYKMNGLFSWWFTWAALAAAVLSGILKPTLLYDNFGPLITTANIFAYGLAFFLFFYGRITKQEDRTTGSAIYDFFMGVSLNPRIKGFDFKFFCESRPGLIGWVVINFSLAAKQVEIHGSMTVPMIMVISFHFFYIMDYFHHEDAILTTMDIMHDKFGWMLAWGDLVWVPFTYTIQAYYLLTHTHDMPWWGAVIIVALNFVGFAIFRLSNYQKHRFRLNPKALVWGKKPEHIKTQQGTLLLTSGWWGMARHINYMGDLMMGLAWCLPCLFGSPLPYFYISYFIILLVQRERRDNHRCRLKYGKDWEQYSKKVRWRIIPYIY